jgi:hypothetical protein
MICKDRLGTNARKPLKRRGCSYTQPGAVNDPDEIYVGQNPPSLSPIEEQTVFAMWAMLTGPLLLGIVSSSLSGLATPTAGSTWVLLYIPYATYTADSLVAVQ